MKHGSGSSQPPRLAERLLERVLPNEVVRNGLMGDLRERFAERRQSSGGVSAVFWYWRETLSAWIRYRFAGLRRKRSSGRDTGPRTFTRRRRSRMSNLVQDVRYAVRMLAKSPGMAAIAIVALTIGIGMPTIMFTVINGVFQDLPVEDPEEILRLFLTDPASGGRQRYVSHPDYADWRSRQTSFEGLAGFAVEDVTLSGGDASPIRRNAALVTPNTFRLLGVTPLVGRSLHEQDVAAGATPVVLLSHGVWQTRYAGDPDVVGRTLTVDGLTRTVVGVMRDRFGFPENEDLWLPLALSLDQQRAEAPELQVFGRLRDGVTIEQANLELRTIAERLAAAHPETHENRSAGAAPFGDGLIDPNFARGLYTMLGAVSFVLLIASINVANLLLARAVTRTREIAVRGALGASRGRVIAQFLTEALLIAGVSGVLGTALAWFGVTVFNQALTSFVGIAWVDISIDAIVLLFVVGVVVFAGMLGGVLPAVRASSVDLNAALKDAPRGAGNESLRVGRFGQGLIVVEIALSSALLVVSGLLIKGVLELDALDLGLPVEQIVTGEVELPREMYPTPEARIQFFEQLEAVVNAIPGVMSVTLMSDIPGTMGYRQPITIEGQTDPVEASPRAGVLTVTPSFLRTLSAPMLDGRGFTSRDRLGSESVAIVNRRSVDEYIVDVRPVGRRVQLGNTELTIVGVVPNLFMGNMEDPDANGPGIYLPYAQSGHVSMQVMARTERDPMSLTAQIRDAVDSMDPSLALMDVDRVDHLIDRETAIFDIFGRLFLFFGLVALFLAAIGLYGVMSFMVRQRTREWGVRLALGAKGKHVVRLATRQAVLLLGIGLTIGLVIAGMLSRPLASFFYRVQPWDALVFTVVTALLFLTGIVATLGPVLRAVRVDPLDALRDE